MFAVEFKHVICCLVWLFALSSFMLGCSNASGSKAPTVVILGAASTKDLLEDIAAAAKASLGDPIEIEISTGPSHALAQQILSGAPADLYVSANRQWAEAIVDADLASDSIDWLANSMVVVAPANSKLSINSLEDLTSADVKRIALAGENVPAGIYAEQALTHYKLWDPLNVAGKIIRGHDVRSALAYVQRGEVDAAIVYATDARLTDDVRVVAKLDPASHTPIIYPLVRMRTSSRESEQVYQFFLGSEARQIAESYGFQTLVTDQGKE
ncbi:molybdate ABC transporter substrate-binding protein [Blastopirellula marina]|uniref:Molybdate ABC transporter substrate-binding protein n=2 Tax=Pirellulales TaxID=2691354 RepID=A0A2S8F1B2_9BACT|nr:molybdate ABC transporter substrate-binding protein [Blastopirellula marina]RCS43397.1 molybdate ABC transporter substrate-binding protein [Bremerella cremea]